MHVALWAKQDRELKDRRKSVPRGRERERERERESTDYRDLQTPSLALSLFCTIYPRAKERERYICTERGGIWHRLQRSGGHSCIVKRETERCFYRGLPLNAQQMGNRKLGVIALFDVDGTLTLPRKLASKEMLDFLQDLRQVVAVGVVGGSDLSKISEQLGKSTISDYDYVFSENGLVAHKDGNLIGNTSLKTFLGDDKLKEFINFTLHYIADLDIPVKRGTFIEFRSGMLNVSPIGRNCSQEERDEFERYDKDAKVREKMVNILREKFAHLNLTFSIGGQISFDVFPQGWDKTYCLKYIEDEFTEIHFFGDKTYKGGNDYEIFSSNKTCGHTVTSPDDTRQQCTTLFL